MAFIPVPNTCKVEMRYQHQGQQIENVYHCVAATPWDLSALNNICEVFAGWNEGVQIAHMVHNCVLTNVLATSLETEFAPGVERPDFGGQAGTVVTADLPMNVTLAVRWVTGIRGRSFRGRTYICGLPAAYITASEIVAEWADDIVNDYTLLKGAVSVEEANMAVVSRRFNNAPRAVGIATVITGVALDRTLDSQRRRLPGRGN